MIEIRPDAFRKRLSLARKEIRAFLAPRCGWISRDNPCRCDRQIDYDLQIGWVDRDRFKYAQRQQLTKVARDRLSDFFDEASLYRSHPRYATSRHLKATLTNALRTIDRLETELAPSESPGTQT
ncbi:MAG: hypothetical protein AAFX94_03720 [Myxococcota bacterium]